MTLMAFEGAAQKEVQRTPCVAFLLMSGIEDDPGVEFACLGWEIISVLRICKIDEAYNVRGRQRG